MLENSHIRESFEHRINVKWHQVKTDLSENFVNTNETIVARCIRSKISFKRVCYSSILSFEKEMHEVSTDVIYAKIGSFYPDGIEAMKKEHSDLHDDIRLVNVEGVIQSLSDSKTLLTIPHKKTLPKNPPTKKELRKERLKKYLKGFFPPLEWFPLYLNDLKKNILGDVISGIVVGCMAIPQALSYAQVAL